MDNAKDEALAKITAARDSVKALPRSREASIAATKLDEAMLWLPPETLCYRKIQDVLVTIGAARGSIRIELTGEERAECQLLLAGETPVHVDVVRPHDRSLVEEATEVMAALYWSRSRVLAGREPGAVTVTEAD